MGIKTIVGNMARQVLVQIRLAYFDKMSTYTLTYSEDTRTADMHTNERADFGTAHTVQHTKKTYHTGWALIHIHAHKGTDVKTFVQSEPWSHTYIYSCGGHGRTPSRFKEHTEPYGSPLIP